MQPNQSLVVVVRLFALWLVGYYITTTPWFFVQTQKYSPESAVLLTLGASAIALSLSAALWYFAPWIASRLMSGINKPEKPDTSFEGWFSVGCALIGLWVLAKAIPALLHYFIANFIGSASFPNSYMVTPEWHLTAIFNAIQLLFGLVLFFGARGLNKVVLWVRNAY